MADTPALVSMAQQFTGLPMDSLIGGPLNAAANANSAMALTQTKFMLDTCFYKTELMDTSQSPPVAFSPPEFSYTPILVKMAITRGVITPGDPTASPPTTTVVDQITTTIDLPLLTIVPLNSLAVDEVNITFEMEVQSSYGGEQSKSTTENIKASADWEVKVGWGPVSATVKGSASYDKTDSSNFSTHYQKSNSAKYTVLVHAGQLPLPNGVQTIIDAYTTAIEPIQLGTAS